MWRITFCSRRRHGVQPRRQHGGGTRDPIFFPPISAPWPFPGPSWGGIDGEWKMSTEDAIATPIGRQRSELCSILCSGGRCWQFYNFQFFGGREFSLPWKVVVASVGHRTNGKLPYGSFSFVGLYQKMQEGVVELPTKTRIFFLDK